MVYVPSIATLRSSRTGSTGSSSRGRAVELRTHEVFMSRSRYRGPGPIGTKINSAEREPASFGLARQPRATVNIQASAREAHASPQLGNYADRSSLLCTCAFAIPASHHQRSPFSPRPNYERAKARYGATDRIAEFPPLHGIDKARAALPASAIPQPIPQSA